MAAVTSRSSVLSPQPAAVEPPTPRGSRLTRSQAPCKRLAQRRSCVGERVDAGAARAARDDQQGAAPAGTGPDEDEDGTQERPRPGAAGPAVAPRKHADGGVENFG